VYFITNSNAAMIVTTRNSVRMLNRCGEKLAGRLIIMTVLRSRKGWHRATVFRVHAHYGIVAGVAHKPSFLAIVCAPVIVIRHTLGDVESRTDRRPI
jgi:hypothetical protein